MVVRLAVPPALLCSSPSLSQPTTSLASDWYTSQVGHTWDQEENVGRGDHGLVSVQPPV